MNCCGGCRIVVVVVSCAVGGRCGCGEYLTVLFVVDLCEHHDDIRNEFAIALRRSREAAAARAGYG